MPSSPVISALRSLVATRFPSTNRKHGGGVPCGTAAIDHALGGGLPAGKLTELVTTEESSGSQLVLSQLLLTTRAARQRVALIDAADSFAPDQMTADALRHLVWVRAGQLETALAAADVLVRDGNYAVLIIDLRGLSARALSRTPAAQWHRLHRAAENQPAAVLVLTVFPFVPAVPWRLVLRGAFGLPANRQSHAERLACITIEIARGQGHTETLSA